MVMYRDGLILNEDSALRMLLELCNKLSIEGSFNEGQNGSSFIRFQDHITLKSKKVPHSDSLANLCDILEKFPERPSQ